jgi:hypothetical protein
MENLLMEKFNHEKRIVAFIDILGFKKHIDSNNKQEELLSILEEMHAKNSSYTPTITSNGPAHQAFHITPDVSNYSDNIILSAPTTPPESARLSFRNPIIYFNAVLAFINNTIKNLQMFALYQGFALRGAISYGDIHFDGKKNIIVGKPLIETIEDERSLAKYPRVIASKKLLEFIAKSQNTTLYELYSRPFNSLSEFRADFDGIYYLDFFKALALTSKDSKKVMLYFQTIKQQIEINITNSMDNLSIASKWYWLANYFDVSVEAWGKKYPEFQISKFNLLKNNKENL